MIPEKKYMNCSSKMMKGHRRQLKIEIFSPNYNIIFKEKLEYNSREMVYTNL